MEVIWKLCDSIMNNQIRYSITMNNTIHRFGQGGWTVTETLEAKLAQQFAGLFCEPLLQVFLDVYKSYDSMEKGSYMEILR